MIFHVKNVLQTIPNKNVTIVAATKYFTPEEMKALYQEGIHHFGENRDDAFLAKYEALKELNITWHFIGTLQTKKVRKVINLIDYLHSLDTYKLAEEIHKRRQTPLKCFLQVNISDEDSKHGLNVNQVIPFLESIAAFTNIHVIGLMGMAEYTEDVSVIHAEFQKLNDLQQQIKDTLSLDLQELSMGMSNDYLIALEHHATFLRLGSVLFSKEV